MDLVIAHYRELLLKGRNRSWFIRRLTRNIRRALRDVPIADIRPLSGRLEITFAGPPDWATVDERLRRVFGLANFARAGTAPLSLPTIADAIVEHLPTTAPASFRVRARRTDKRFPHPSPAIEREVGARIVAARGWRVDLDDPALVVGVELLPHEAYFHFGKQDGAGGLPTGTAGRVVVLLSGGIDSPVAAWRLMRRGCLAALVHFHSYPFLSQASQEKARDLARLLAGYQQESRLHLVPFGELQRQVMLTTPAGLRVVIYRRLMLRIAERIAHRLRAQALVTGDVIGQVASQTLDNLAVVSAVARLPLLRPLIGLDKEEITAEAARLGTLPISLVPDEDCCTLFSPRHPATRARILDVERAESALPIDDMVRAALDATVVERLSCRGDKIVRPSA